MITVRTKSSQNVRDVVRFFNRNFPEAVLKVSRTSSWGWSVSCSVVPDLVPPGPLPGAAPHEGPVPAQV
jgi:hypothetical protein